MAMAKIRVYLPFAAWPAANRQAWDELFREGDILDGQGTAANWAPATRNANLQHCARFLGWLASIDSLTVDGAPAERITPDVVAAYARDVVARVAPRTAAPSLIGLKVVAQAMAPEGDWRWLADLTNRLNCWATPSRDPQAAIVPINAIYDACRAELDRLLETPLTGRIERVAFRDTLICLILAAAPVRLRNLAMIETGTHLLSRGPHFQLRFDARETKNRQALKLDLPAGTTDYIGAYLTRVRPSFGSPSDTMLWIGFEGRPLTAHSIYGRIMRVTERLLGAGINPHAFRACAATSLSLHSPGAARLAAPLLGHRCFATTERHYIRARQIEASRTISDVLAAIRAGEERSRE